jgi:SNF2 family DNA or RNA helicase
MTAEPVRPRAVATSDVNRAGVARDQFGNDRLCYSGSREVVRILLSMHGACYWREYDCVSLPCSRTNLLVLETVGQVRQAGNRYREVRDELLKAPIYYRAIYPAPAEGQPEPYEHQIEAFSAALDTFDTRSNGFGQFAEMGCGKTRWCIDLMKRKVQRAGLVVGMNATILQWRSALEMNWPEARAVPLTGMPIPKRLQVIEEVMQTPLLGSGGPPIFLVNWEALSRMQQPLMALKPCLFAADEASKMKDRRTQMSKAAYAIAGRSVNRVAMTGTPIGNDPGDLFALYRFIDPLVFGSNYWNYMETYFKLGFNREWLGFREEKVGDFMGKMYSCAHRVTKASIGGMPEPQPEEVRLDMTPEQSGHYKQVADEMFASFQMEDGREASLSVANAMTRMLRLQQITAGVLPITSVEGEAVEGPRYRSIPSAKTEWLADYVRETLDNSDNQIVVWVKFTGELKNICHALKTKAKLDDDQFGFIDGSVKNEDRERLRVTYNDRTTPLRVLIIQIQAGSYGLDLPSADVMVYHSLTFSAIEQSQSEERGLRLGRKREYRIIYLLCRSSVDSYVMRALKQKRDFANMLMVSFKGAAGLREAING